MPLCTTTTLPLTAPIPRSTVSQIALFCFLAILAGCRDISPRQVDVGHFRFPDSAPANVRDLSIDELTRAPEWFVDARPLAIIGNGSGEETIGNLTYAALLKDGRFLAADAYGNRLLVFSSSGVLEETWGRGGAGPGEFQWPAWIGYCQREREGFEVYDAILHTMTSLSHDGSVVSSRRALIPPRNSVPYSNPVCNDDGYLAAFTEIDYPDEVDGTLYRPSGKVALWDVTGEFGSVVVNIPGPDRYRIPGADGELGDFGRKPLLGISRRRLFVATGDAFEIASYSLDQQTYTLIRSDVERAPVTTADLARVFDEQLSANRSMPQRTRDDLRRTLETMQWPAFHPVLQALVVDDQGCVWVWHNRGSESAPVWRVLDELGEPLGVLVTPSGFNLLQVAGERLVGIQEDELGVKRIAVYQYDGPEVSACGA